ncbi:hypothetical protein [Sphingosinicella rhizophila]|uniref:hypothetical protein n=1 Tax=Sphingosinicella rhizophila TaxID=3050082 RepID=UPI0028E69875|nr:hypothetical protein [Sphingosinicella sp. GR2756]
MPAPVPSGVEENGDDAAAALRLYYALIEEKRYDRAWRMRSGGAGLADFAASFRRYRSYRATVGTPSLPVEAGGWAYVEVPVQIFGTLRDGGPVATAGSVTMRRATTAVGDRRWRIHAR